MRVKIGILDTGLLAEQCTLSKSFLQSASTENPPQPQQHGPRLGEIVVANCDTAELLDARTFCPGQPTTPAQIVQAIDWLVEQQVAIINMSFGLQHDRELLADAIARAQCAGVCCVASAPAQGSPVYPASYPGVICVSGDARCSAGKFSLLKNHPNWHFGAANGGVQHRAHQRGWGASYACAHVCGALAQLLADGKAACDLPSLLSQQCQWTGAECRF